MSISPPPTASSSYPVRTDWTQEEVTKLFALPFNDLLFQAHSAHRHFFDPNQVQISSLLSIKTGACPEDCAYCPQSVRYQTDLENENLMAVDDVIARARAARKNGATRFCMGAAYRRPKAGQLEQITAMVKAVHDLGMETCATLGMLDRQQADQLKDAGLDYYNHNLDTSESYYPEIITTRSYQDRLDTLRAVREAGLKVCCGGILGMGESRQDRIDMLHTMATLPEHPGSVPINQLIQVAGTPLEDATDIDPIDFVTVIAVARLLMPASHIRLSAGRTRMSEEMQALCFFAGANSVFFGEKLLTTDNPDSHSDRLLLQKLGMRPEPLRAGSL